MEFAEKIQQAVEHTVLSFLQKGSWLSIDYNSGVKVSAGDLKAIFARVDMKRVADLVLAEVEQMVATKIVHAMATELSTDIKKILSNNELREDLRGSIREKMAAGAANIQESR